MPIGLGDRRESVGGKCPSDFASIALPCYARTMQGPVAARTATYDLALERMFPGLTGRLPRHALTTLPTPVQALHRLGRLRGISSIWVKRDDCSGELYGGNKPRKLEWLLGEARRRSRRVALTFGGIGTHHGLATTICARDAGLRTILVLVPQPLTDHVRRCVLLDYALGAELHLAEGVLGAAATAIRLLASGRARGEAPALIPAGGTSPVGVIGYVNAACELAEQVRAGEMPEPDVIFVPLGSGGTAAGLMLGVKLAGLRSRVAAVLVSDIMPPSAARLARLARASWKRLRNAYPDLPPVSLGRGDVAIIRDFLGRGYGDPTEDAIRVQALLEDVEGIRLETTYTAKCMAALLRLAEQSPYRGQTILFWNTYSSVDPGARLRQLPDFRELPRAFHRFFGPDR